jgi:hypothetical protein
MRTIHYFFWRSRADSLCIDNSDSTRQLFNDVRLAVPFRYSGLLTNLPKVAIIDKIKNTNAMPAHNKQSIKKHYFFILNQLEKTLQKPSKKSIYYFENRNKLFTFGIQNEKPNNLLCYTRVHSPTLKKSFPISDWTAPILFPTPPISIQTAPIFATNAPISSWSAPIPKHTAPI